MVDKIVKNTDQLTVIVKRFINKGENKMDTTTTKLVLDKLTELSHSLGTTADNIYKILIKQAAIESQISLFWIIVLSILLILVLTVSLKILFNCLKGKYGEDSKIISVTTTVFTIFILFLILAFLYKVVCNYLITVNNPEYWALNKILEKVFTK